MSIKAPRPTKVFERAKDLGFEDRSSGGLVLKEFPGYGGVGSSSLTQMLMGLAGRDDITSPFIQNPWVHGCMQVRARAGESVPGRLFASDDDEADEVTSGELWQLLQKPNPLLSQADLWRLLWHHLDLCGETFWVLMRKVGGVMQPIQPGQVPQEIWPIRGDQMNLSEQDLDEKTKLPKQWRTNTSVGETIYPAHAVCHIYFPDPENPLRGIGPLQALARRLSIEFKGERFDEALVNNGGRPGAVIEAPGMMTPDQVQALREQYIQKYGQAEDDGKPLVLQGGGKVTIPGFSPKDMQLGDMRIWNRQVVMSLYGVTKPLLAITDEVNFANGREAKKVFWEDTIAPTLTSIANKITSHLIANLSGTENKYRFEFDLTGVVALQEDQDAKIERTIKLFETGIMTFNEAAALSGWEIDGLEGGDEKFKPAAPSEPVVEPEQDLEEESNTIGTRAVTAPPTVTKEADPMASAEARAVFARAFDESLIPHDKGLAKAVAKWQTDYVKSVRRAFIDFAESEVSLDVDAFMRNEERISTPSEWERLLGELESFKEGLGGQVTPQVKAVIDEQAKLLALNELGVAESLLTDTNRFYLDLVDTKVFRLTETLETVRDLVRETVRSAILEDGGLGSTSQQIREALESIKGNLNTMTDKLGTRAELIARTETTSIANGARTEEMKLQGVTEHRWITAGDGEVRESHNLDGEVRTVGELFSNGLKHPGDPNASVEEVANCRCATSPVPPEE